MRLPRTFDFPDYDSPAGTYVNWTRNYTGLTDGNYTVKVNTGNSPSYGQGEADGFSLKMLTYVPLLSATPSGWLPLRFREHDRGLDPGDPERRGHA